MNPDQSIRTCADGRRAAAIRDGRAEAGDATTAVMAPRGRCSLALSTLNGLTATGQVVANGAASAARIRAEHAATERDPERAARHQRDAIRWQEDAADLYAKARRNYAVDNGLADAEAGA
jgi:hypothetical protein